MRIAVSGSTGFIGSCLVDSLRKDGHEILRLVRRPKGTDEPEVAFNPEDDLVDRQALQNLDAVVHLAGESIAGLWTESKKQAIRRSRSKGTRFLAEVLASLPQPPSVFASASATGFYGDRGDELLTEDSEPGTGFLASVCREWEEATRPALDAGIRVVNLRFGVVLDPAGGILKTMLPPFRLGLGGRLGNGNQYMSWISREDAIEAVKLTLRREDISGPVNVVSPNPLTNKEFTKTLAQALSRPALLPMPKAILETALGDMAREMLLAGQRVSPRKLAEHEFHYRDPQIQSVFERLHRR
jgi:uncharacterized protein (TIGR01777 family)